MWHNGKIIENAGLMPLHRFIICRCASSMRAYQPRAIAP